MIKKVVSFIFGLLIFNISLNLRAQEIVGPDKGDLKFHLHLILLILNNVYQDKLEVVVANVS